MFIIIINVENSSAASYFLPVCFSILPDNTALFVCVVLKVFAAVKC